MKESAVTSHVLLEAVKHNCNLMRNNVGAGTIIDENGNERQIRWGLMNESKKQNDQVKSSDFIGLTPVWCYREHIGWGWVGVFTAIEMKASDWRFVQSDKRALAQSRFHDMVRGYGGFAGFATCQDDLKKIIGVR